MIHEAKSKKSDSSRPSSLSKLSVPTNGRVFAIAFSQGTEIPDAFLALGLTATIQIFQVRCQDQDDEPVEDVAALNVFLWRELNHKTRVQTLAWPLKSPQGFLSLASGGADGKVRLFRMHPQNPDEDEVQTLFSHSDYVNCVAFEPEYGEMVASGSDDCSLVLHRLTTGQNHTVTFGSPVMSASWHKAEPSKLMAAEKRGLIHIINTTSYQPIMSFSMPSGPLLSAHWSLTNSLYIVAAVKSDVQVWDISCPSTPVLSKNVHEEGTRHTLFSSFRDSIVATSGQPNYSVKVFDLKSFQLHLHVSNKPVGGLAWHPRFPCLAVGGDECVTLYMMPNLK